VVARNCPPPVPLKFPSADILQKKIDEYFESLQAIDKIEYEQPDGSTATKWQRRWLNPPTVTGLALYLGTTRETLLDYQADYDYNGLIEPEERERLSVTVRRAKAKVEQYAEEMLFLAKSANGPQFALKNNFRRWADESHLIQSHTIKADIDPSRLSADELEALESLLSKARSPAALPAAPQGLISQAVPTQPKHDDTSDDDA
jgi:hypothetical protein